MRYSDDPKSTMSEIDHRALKKQVPLSEFFRESPLSEIDLERPKDSWRPEPNPDPPRGLEDRCPPRQKRESPT
jgi:hypothetical protein